LLLILPLGAYEVKKRNGDIVEVGHSVDGFFLEEDSRWRKNMKFQDRAKLSR